jgi:hypothetical protein
VIPVPMLTANQEGVKLRIRRRHSREMEEVGVVGWAGMDGLGAGGGGEREMGVDAVGGDVDKFLVDILNRPDCVYRSGWYYVDWISRSNG